jgi:ankyrin repeat protein
MYTVSSNSIPFKIIIDTKLIEASKYEHLNVIKRLLEYGAHVHADDNDAIQMASEYGHLDVVKLLLESGADIHARDNYAIRWESKNGHLSVVKLLYWRYHVSKRRSIREMFPGSKILWQDISNCELLYLPWELIELIKRFC